jgi:hypothetical protein
MAPSRVDYSSSDLSDHSDHSDHGEQSDHSDHSDHHSEYSDDCCFTGASHRSGAVLSSDGSSLYRIDMHTHIMPSQLPDLSTYPTNSPSSPWLNLRQSKAGDADQIDMYVGKYTCGIWFLFSILVSGQARKLVATQAEWIAQMNNDMC